MLPDSELIYRIALSELYPGNLRQIRMLLDQFTCAEQAWTSVTENGKKDALTRAKQEWEFIQKHKISVFTPQDDTYPYRLRQCPDAPVLLYGKGNLQLNDGHFLSIVGTRTPTERGKDLCRKLVLELAQKIPHLTIVSGLAYGIDICAHRAALEAKIPTIIIPGHGLDRIYPSIHRPESVQSLSQGGILTEYPSGTEPYGSHFVARNRIIAGLGDAVVVVESKLKGGSLITAHMAQDYNRDIFAFPGRVDDTTSAGCNLLIKNQQAQLIESADDIIRYMQWETTPTPNLQTQIEGLCSDLTTEQITLLDLLRHAEDGIHVNLLVMETNRPYHEVSTDLTFMEMQDVVKSLPGGVWMARK